VAYEVHVIVVHGMLALIHPFALGGRASCHCAMAGRATAVTASVGGRVGEGLMPGWGL
jgi:hypothetical protein